MCKGWLIINKDYLPKSKNFNEKFFYNLLNSLK